MAQAKGLGQQDLGEALKNPKVLIGLGVGVAVIVIGVVVFMLMNRPPAVDATATGTMGVGDTAMSPGTTDMASGAPGMDPGMPGAVPPGGDPGMMGGGSMAMGAAPGMDPSMTGGAPAPAGGQPAGAEVKKQAPGVPVKKNPFQPNTELKEIIQGIPIPEEPGYVSQAHDLYQELYTPPPAVASSEADDGSGPPVPAMRVSGIVQGAQVSAMVQMGSEYMQVTPGQMIPKDNPVYRVERIEPEKVILTRKWEMGGQKGTQRIEVGLMGNPAAAAGMGGPGMMGGSGGTMGGPGMMMGPGGGTMGGPGGGGMGSMGGPGRPGAR